MGNNFNDNKVPGYVYLDEGDRVIITTVQGIEYWATVSSAVSGVATMVIDPIDNNASGLKSLSKKPIPTPRHAMMAAFRAGMRRSHRSADGKRIYRIGDLLITVTRGDDQLDGN